VSPSLFLRSAITDWQARIHEKREKFVCSCNSPLLSDSHLCNPAGYSPTSTSPTTLTTPESSMKRRRRASHRGSGSRAPDVGGSVALCVLPPGMPTLSFGRLGTRRSGLLCSRLESCLLCTAVWKQLAKWIIPLRLRQKYIIMSRACHFCEGRPSLALVQYTLSFLHIAPHQALLFAVPVSTHDGDLGGCLR
jgi:hypothetical protein